MKRNMSLVREILLSIEDEETGYAPNNLSLEGYSREQIGYHALILLEAGLIDGQETTSMDSHSPSAIATRLTWAGHEFLDAARDKGRWTKALSIVQDKGGGAVTIGVLTQLLSALAKQSISLD